MGGATSIDKANRIDRVSWWNEENISKKDIDNGLNNLSKVNMKVDYVLSHCCPTSIVKKMFGYREDNNTKILEYFNGKIEYNHWYFGHYHQDMKYGKYRCFYNDILEIPVMDVGRKIIKYPTLERSSSFDDMKYYPYLFNRKTFRKTNIVEEDLPEWYFHNFSYRDFYYCLKDVTDIAFHGSPFDNHISKDSRIYLHYHGKLKKKSNYEPFNEDDWDTNTWRCDIYRFCLGLEKYSPSLNLNKLKARINLVYDQYNHGYNGPVIRPFPNIKTPHYVDRYSKEKAQYVVLFRDIILSEFLNLDTALNYVQKYIEKELRIETYREIVKENDDYVKAYDLGYEDGKLIYIKKIEY